MTRVGRGASLKDFKDELHGLEARRVELNVTVEQWAHKAGVSFATLMRARASGKAKPGTLKLLRSALRSIRIEQNNAHMFEVHHDA